MDTQQNRILKEIEANTLENDAAFAELLAEGPRLSLRYKVGLGVAAVLGMALTMMFLANVMFGVIGYLVLVGIATDVLRRRPLKPAEQSPVEVVHRLTAGLFRNTATVSEPSLD